MQFLDVNLQQDIFQFSALQIVKLINNSGAWGMGPEGGVRRQTKRSAWVTMATPLSGNYEDTFHVLTKPRGMGGLGIKWTRTLVVLLETKAE